VLFCKEQQLPRVAWQLQKQFNWKLNLFCVALLRPAIECGLE
jgi:hypothetical protein